jgi:hypothetical protein
VATSSQCLDDARDVYSFPASARRAVVVDEVHAYVPQCKSIATRVFVREDEFFGTNLARLDLIHGAAQQ